MLCPFPLNRWEGVSVQNTTKGPATTPRPFSLPDERGIFILMLAAASIAMLFLVCSRSAAREDERMGIRFEGEGVMRRD